MCSHDASGGVQDDALTARGQGEPEDAGPAIDANSDHLIPWDNLGDQHARDLDPPITDVGARDPGTGQERDQGQRHDEGEHDGEDPG